MDVQESCVRLMCEMDRLESGANCCVCERKNA